MTDVGAFRHDALFYEGDDDFLRRIGAFIEDGVAAREPVLVVVAAAKIRSLRDSLGGTLAGVRFVDMADIGHNPARIIPAWREFVDEFGRSGARARGIGEPIWATRSPEELAECARHESLLNVAFAGGTAEWWLACPYDTTSLAPSILEEARRNHPHVVEDGRRAESPSYRGLDAAGLPFDEPLPEPEGSVQELTFGSEPEALVGIRSTVAAAASADGLDEARIDDLVLVVNEVATNSVRHGGGRGTLRIWSERRRLICEVRDAGRILDPLVGRVRPHSQQRSGFGLWLANQLCDLVQIRSFPTGSVVRLHVVAT